jgi:ribosomal protein S18
LERKPMQIFEEELLNGNYRSGKMTDKEIYEKNWRSHIEHVPIFLKKPKDPFALKQEEINRISFKNMTLLKKFITLSGKIMNSRYYF